MGVLKKQFILDNKSIRIMYRLNNYIKENKISSFEKLLKSDIYSQTVRIKDKPDS